jgi:hypothetical protein
MIDEVFALLLDKRSDELTGKELESGLDKWERAELRAIEAHKDKSPAVAQRIRILAGKMVQPSIWALMMARFSRKFKQNLAELEALIHYGHSTAVWEIAYLNRKKAAGELSPRETFQLEALMLYHDSPHVLRLAELKVKEAFDNLAETEQRELSFLQRNIYRSGVPAQLLEMLWPTQGSNALDLSRL